MNEKRKNFCKDCGETSIYHIQTWLEEIIGRFISSRLVPKWFELFLDVALEKIFIFSGLISAQDNFDYSDFQPRSACVIAELRKRGVKIKALRGPFGYTSHFRAEAGGKVARFASLPTADFASKRVAWLAEDKAQTKDRLKKGGFPIAEGRSFYFWQKKNAMQYGVKELGFPLVVKPRGGSVSRHVSTNIRDPNALEKAIAKAVAYSPAFVIERFIYGADVYRATVVDFNVAGCVRQVPANVVGDGVSTIRALINEKNSNPARGEPQQKKYVLNKIVQNETTKKLLNEKKYNFSSVPKLGEVVFLQNDPFIKLGGDLAEMTGETHPDNLKLFSEAAKFFDMRVAGIDFMAEDISRSYKEQRCAVLELNSVPCIDFHHFPSSGSPQNVAGAVADLFFKYYL